MWGHSRSHTFTYKETRETLRGGAHGRRALGGHGEELHLAPRDAEHVAHLDRPPRVLDEEVGATEVFQRKFDEKKSQV